MIFPQFRDADIEKKLVEKIHRDTTKPWVLMEICGGQTHSIMQYGIDK